MAGREGMCRRLILVALLVCLAALATEGCSPPIGGYKPPTLEYKMFDSDVVAYGVTRKVYPNDHFPGEDVYSVDFQVYCIFKGEPLAEMIRIDHVGSIPGLCISTNMTVGQPLLVYLRKDGNQFEPNYKEDPGGNQYLDEVIVLCEAIVAYPSGRDANNYEESCPEPYEYDDCVPIPTPTEPPTLPTERTPPMPPTPPDNGAPSSENPPPKPPADPESRGTSEGEPVEASVSGEIKATEGDKTPVGNVQDDTDPNSASTIALHLTTPLLLLIATMAL